MGKAHHTCLAGEPPARQTVNPPARGPYYYRGLFDTLGPNWIRPGRERLSWRVEEHAGLVKSMHHINC